MVFMNDPRDVEDLRLFHETVSKPNQTVICAYDTENMVDIGFRQISAALGVFALQIKRRDMLMANKTRVFFTTRERLHREFIARGRDNVTVIG